eukprot:NODE_143_length_17796_cov_0.252020.p11 type:complete len:130 gc:universal NODE_143_length_17796_cov_0.252020:6157-6546(+)
MVIDKLYLRVLAISFETHFMFKRFSHILLSQDAVKKLSKVKGILRIDVSSGGCHGFSYDVKLDSKIDEGEDQIIEQDGVKVVVDKMALSLVKGSTLHFRTTAMGSAFVLENPNAESSCGCGHSFSVRDL